MNENFLDRYQRLAGRTLTEKETLRLREIKDALSISDNDAVWDILILLDYHRKFCEEMPVEIEKKMQHILGEIEKSAEAEVAKNQAVIAASLIEYVKKMGGAMSLKSVIMAALAGVSAAFIIASLAFAFGFLLGTGKTQPPGLPAILQLPVGILLGAVSCGVGAFLLLQAARLYADGIVVWKKILLGGAAAFVIGTSLVAVTFR